MTVAVKVVGPPVLAPEARPARAWMGYLPSVVLAFGTAATLTRFGVTWSQLAAFVVYLTLAVTTPGTLIWRAVRRRPGCLAEDLAAGTAVGMALDVLAYLPARAAGVPLLFLAAPLATLAVFALRPRLRAHWRPAVVERAPLWWSIGLALLLGALVVVSCVTVFRYTGISPADYRYTDFTDGDMPFHLANIGELKHHLPPHVPYVDGDPLYYHWFSYADMAATSWATGIEPLVLLRRLSPMLYVAVTVILIAVTARRLTGRRWAGLAAVVVTYFVLAPHPYAWRFTSWLTGYGFGIVDDGSLLRQNLYASPTQSFGAAIFAAVVLLLIDGLRGRVPTAPALALLAGLLVVVMGGKATFLPLLAVGLVAIVVVDATWRRLNPFALISGTITLVCLGFAQIVLFGGSAQGLYWAPLRSTDYFGLWPETGVPRWVLLAVIAVTLTCVWGGVLALGRAAGRPEIILLLCVGAAGLGMSYLFHQGGLSNTFFLQSARPYLSLAAVSGLAVLMGNATRQRVLIAVGAAGAGAGAVLVIRTLTGTRTPTLASSRGELALAWTVLWPYGLLLGVVLALLLAGRALPGRRLGAVMAVTAMLGAGGLAGGYDRVLGSVRGAASTGLAVPHPYGPAYALGTWEAGRWLREHSDPDDLVATNAHCSPAASAATTCTPMHFTVSAFTERRVLVEGWAYTARSNARARELGAELASVSFHDPALLAANDAAFATPSAATVGVLRDRYGVRWLFAERSQNPPAATLGDFARLRYASGDCAVYELR